MSSLPIYKLNGDLLLEVFEWVNSDDLYHNLLNITLACKRWHAVAQSMIDRTVNVVIAKAFETRNLKLFCRLWYDTSLRSRVKRIHVREWHHDRLETFKEIRPKAGATYYYSPSYETPSQNWDSTSKQITALAKSLERLSLVSFKWSATPPMPRELALVLAKQQDCTIAISRNRNAVDATGWSFTPLANHQSLQTITLLNARSTTISKLDFLVLADDHGVLSSIGFIVSSTSNLRSLKIHAIGATPPFATGRSKISQKILVKGLDWLQHPLRHVDKRLRLEELQLTNICVCGLDCFSLADTTDVHALRSLSLSCMQLLLQDGVNFPRLQELRLRFRSGRPRHFSQCTTEWPRETVRSALLGLTDLKVLEIIDRVDVLSELVFRTLGPQLVTLRAIRRIPDEKHSSELYPRSQFSWIYGYPYGFIESVSAFCPNLAELAVTVPGVTLRFKSVLNDIASLLPSLSVLHLYRPVDPFPPGTGESTRQAYGLPNESIRPIWRKLQQSTAHGILELHLHLLRGTTLEASQTFTPFRDQCSQLRTIVARRMVSEQLRSHQETQIFMVELEDVERAIKQGEPDPGGDQGNHWSHKKKVLEQLAKYGVSTRFRLAGSRYIEDEPQMPPQDFLDAIQ